MRASFLRNSLTMVVFLAVCGAFVLSGCGGSGSGAPAANTSSVSGYSWTWADGGGAYGINYSTAENAEDPNQVVLNGKLYSAWNEKNGSGVWQIRVAAYDGTAWTFVDADGPNGINYSAAENSELPQLAVFNNNLYATWRETNSSGIYQIRVAEYTGAGWTFVDGGGANGINYDPSMGGAYASQMAVFNGKLYVTWWEWASGTTTAQLRVRAYDGTSWTWADGGGTYGINYNTAYSASDGYLAAFNGNLYAEWKEQNASGIGQLRVAEYTGAGWTFVDGGGANGINYDTAEGSENHLLAVYNGALYTVWSEETGSGGNGPRQIRAAVYNGTGWSFVDGGLANGINYNAADDVDNPSAAVYNGSLYATWTEGANNGSGPYQIRAADYNGTGWTFVDGDGANGLNYTPADTDGAWDPNLSVFNNMLFDSWEETNASGGVWQIRVKAMQ